MAIARTSVAVGMFGTYDALAGAGFMLGFALLLPEASEQRVPTLHLLAAAVLMFVAFLSKYLVAIYFPIVCLYVMLRHGRRVGAALRETLSFVAPLSVLCAGYAAVFSDH